MVLVTVGLCVARVLITTANSVSRFFGVVAGVRADAGAEVDVSVEEGPAWRADGEEGKKLRVVWRFREAGVRRFGGIVVVVEVVVLVVVVGRRDGWV